MPSVATRRLRKRCARRTTSPPVPNQCDRLTIRPPEHRCNLGGKRSGCPRVVDPDAELETAGRVTPGLACQCSRPIRCRLACMHGAAHFGASALIAGFAFSLSAFAVASPVSPPTVPSTRHDAKYCGEVFDDGAYDVSVYITHARGPWFTRAIPPNPVSRSVSKVGRTSIGAVPVTASSGCRRGSATTAALLSAATTTTSRIDMHSGCAEALCPFLWRLE